MNNIGLVLEGGGMRGVYTAGVLEFFLDADIEFPYVIGVSAGACNAASYLSKQKGRNKKVNIGFSRDPKYLSLRNYWKNKELFGMDYVFDEIPNRLVPYDYEMFHQNGTEFVVGTTDCETGLPYYLNRSIYDQDILTAIRASSSLPFFAPVVSFQNRLLLDGGISDPVPIKKAMIDGYKNNIVILTRNKSYRKKPSRLAGLVKRKYPQFPNLYQVIQNRWKHYNETSEFIEKLEKNGEIFVIRPSKPLKVSRIEKKAKRLEDLYNTGYMDAENLCESLHSWMKERETLPLN